ncbi:MAG: hypothetical protein ACRENF_03345, partial [Thermodesulfobacteriota bacterium]
MAIPYSIKSLLPGRVQINSVFLKYVGVPEETINDFILKQEGTLNVKASKKTGNLTIVYDVKKFNPGMFLKILDDATPELMQHVLSQAQNGNGKKVKEKEEGNAKKWFISSTLGLLPFLFRASIPSGFLTGLTVFLAIPIFEKALSSIKNKKIDVHLLDSSALALATLRGSPFSSMLMVWLLSLGDLIEERTQGAARKEIEKLLSYKDEKAWLLTEDGNAIEVPVDQIRRGDKIVVYTG